MSPIKMHASAAAALSSPARALAMALCTVLLATGLALAGPAKPAEASVTYCSKTDCTIYFSKSETRAIANGYVPRIPAGPIGAALTVLFKIYQYGAKIAASRGQCTAFTVTLVPWHNNGYYPYSCNWQ
jgi:hypothetical protein